MSQLPRYGGQGAKSAKTTTTKTTRIPGTNTVVTQSKTVVADVTTCGTEPQGNVRVLAQSGSSRLEQSRLQQRGPQQVRRPEACASNTCIAGPRGPARPTGLPQVRLQGLPRSTLPQPGPEPAVQQSRAVGGGLPRPQAARMQQTTSMGLQQPKPSGLQRPAPTGLPQPSGLQRPTGLQQPKPSGLQRPAPRGLQQPRAGMPRYVAPQTVSRATGLRPPGGRPGGLPQPSRRSPTPQQIPQVCGGPCSSQQVGITVQPATPVREPRPRPIPPQTPARALPERPPPSAPMRRTERPRGPEAYKQFLFESKYKLKKPKAPGLIPSPGERRKRGPSAEERASKTLIQKSIANEGDKVTARAANISPCEPRYIETPEGMQPVLKEAVLEKRIERDEEGEKIVKNLQIVDTDTGGMPKMIEMNLQQLDPNYPIRDGKEVIAITSKVSMSESYSTVTQHISRAITETVPEAASMPPEEIAKLVAEENEDVDNTLKMLPPDLVLSPGKYEIKKRLQRLQLNSESVALLEQSIIRPEARADEAQTEPTPEVMAAMMHTVEKGVPPQSTPDQVFNTLFVETSNERYIKLSPVTQGPLQDVVVPTAVPVDVHKEVITDDMEKLTEKLQNIPTAAEIPTLDIFDQVMAADAKSPTKGNIKDISFRPISDEKSLWVNANLEHLVNIVGATPVDVLDPANVNELENSGTLEQQMATGVEYYVDADPIQYMSRVQLRGTQLPSYFPGYLVALPEFPDVVKLASSPDEVFSSAWKSAQPKYFPDECTQSLIY